MPTNPITSTASSVNLTALRYFALNGTDHRSHDEQHSMTRRYISWRNPNEGHPELRAVSWRASVA